MISFIRTTQFLIIEVKQIFGVLAFFLCLDMHMFLSRSKWLAPRNRYHRWWTSKRFLCRTFFSIGIAIFMHFYRGAIDHESSFFSDVSSSLLDSLQFVQKQSHGSISCCAKAIVERKQKHHHCWTSERNEMNQKFRKRKTEMYSSEWKIKFCKQINVGEEFDKRSANKRFRLMINASRRIEREISFVSFQMEKPIFSRKDDQWYFPLVRIQDIEPNMFQ